MSRIKVRGVQETPNKSDVIGPVHDIHTLPSEVLAGESAYYDGENWIAGSLDIAMYVGSYNDDFNTPAVVRGWTWDSAINSRSHDIEYTFRAIRISTGSPIPINCIFAMSVLKNGDLVIAAGPDGNSAGIFTASKDSLGSAGQIQIGKAAFLPANNILTSFGFSQLANGRVLIPDWGTGSILGSAGNAYRLDNSDVLNTGWPICQSALASVFPDADALKTVKYDDSASDLSGRLWVGRYNNPFAARFDTVATAAPGALAASITYAGSNWDGVTGIAVDKNGNLFACTYNDNKINVVLAASMVVGPTVNQVPDYTITVPSIYTGIDKSCFDNLGNLWVACHSSNHIIGIQASDLGSGGLKTPFAVLPWPGQTGPEPVVFTRNWGVIK